MQAGPRTIIWTQLWEAALRQPWLGYGWNQVSVAQMNVAADFGTTRFTEHSHNLLLDLVLWNGFPIAIALIGCGVWFLVSRARRVRSVDGLFGIAFICIFLMHSMVEFPLDYLYFLVPFGLAIGIVESDSGVGDVQTLSRGVGLGFGGVAAVMLAVVAFDYMHFEDKYRDLRLTLARVGTPLVSVNDPPVKTLFSQLAALYNYPLIEVGANMPAEQIAWMGHVAARHPYVPVLYRYALAQALNGDSAGAALTFSKMKRLHRDRNYTDAKMQFEELANTRYPQLKAIKLD
jgi:hypothetical protein